MGYASAYFRGGEWPAEVILALLALDDPDRTYAIDINDDDDHGLFYYDDAVDVVEARKKEVAELENRLAELKRQLAGS
jgi:hypothetical protein